LEHVSNSRVWSSHAQRLTTNHEQPSLVVVGHISPRTTRTLRTERGTDVFEELNSTFNQILETSRLNPDPPPGDHHDAKISYDDSVSEPLCELRYLSQTEMGSLDISAYDGNIEGTHHLFPASHHTGKYPKASFRLVSARAVIPLHPPCVKQPGRSRRLADSTPS
jgi:hypothetical protein